MTACMLVLFSNMKNTVYTSNTSKIGNTDNTGKIGILRNSMNMSNIGNTRQKQKEDRQAYSKLMNQNIVRVRMTAKERALLRVQMSADGWTNMSAFIRHQLFGLDPDRKVDALVKAKSPDSIALLLRYQLMELTSQYIYIRSRYDRDMSQLYREEGVDLKRWSKATNKWHAALVKATNASFALLRKVAVQLGLNDFLVTESDDMSIDLDNATKEELDALAAQIHKENTALGRPDTFD